MVYLQLCSSMNVILVSMIFIFLKKIKLHNGFGQKTLRFFWNLRTMLTKLAWLHSLTKTMSNTRKTRKVYVQIKINLTITLENCFSDGELKMSYSSLKNHKWLLYIIHIHILKFFLVYLLKTWIWHENDNLYKEALTLYPSKFLF